jgi:F-type H+-transporting ATPase subunit epsilon
MSFAVELVSPSQRVWSGQAEMVSARTIDGDLGILSGHTQLFGVLVDGTVTIKSTDGSTTDFNISGGFLSVANNRVSILTESVS